jgi:LuxR family maltose regulon positive regulatory protein
METPLVRTKLHIPSPRPKRVARARLVERLNAGVHGKLTLISAPAGFGKTTLVSEWIHSGVGNMEYGVRNTPYSDRQQVGLPTPLFAWLSLSEGDNDLTRFLIYFIAALQTALQTPVLSTDAPADLEGTEARQEPARSIGKGALAVLASSGPQSPQLPTETILSALINEIAALSDQVFLVLDDYHLIEAQPIHDALTFLLRHLPPAAWPSGGLHLVIVTREDPPLPLARLRARGQLAELRAADLRFTPSEAAEFLNRVMGLDLSEEDITALEARTEGWIAGLQLAALSMQKRLGHGMSAVTSFIQSFTGSHHFVLDYLVEEVLDQQSKEVQTFLLQTAILDQLTGSLCDALRFGVTKSQRDAKQPSGAATLRMLQQANLFIVPLDEERRWYRYHHLFADLLRQRLCQAEPELVPTLHVRASEWYEQNGFAVQAIEHALYAEDLHRAAHLIDERADAIWQHGEHANLRRWLDELPAELVFSNPQLCILHAWNLLASGQLDAAERSLHAAEKTLDTGADRDTEGSPTERDQLPGTDRTKLRGRAAALQAIFAAYRGDIPGIIRYSRQALEHLPEQDLTWRSTATLGLGDAYSLKGEFEAAYRARLESYELSKAAGNFYHFLIASLKLAVTLRVRGQLQRIARICRQQAQLANESGWAHTAVVGWLLAIWGEVLAELNDLDGAIHQARKGAQLTERGGDVMMLCWSHLCLMRVLLSRGELAAAQEIIQKLERIDRESDLPPLVASPIAAWQARLWLAEDKLEAASQWVEDRGLVPDGEPTLLHEMEYIVYARILVAQRRLEEATRMLQRLLKVTEAGGRTFRAIEILMLQALAFQAGGDTAQAMAALQRSLTLAEPGGFIRIFVDEGPPMAHLLYKAATRGVSPDYARRLLTAFPVAEPGRPDPSKSQASKSELIEPLSERELEVLVLIAEGLTNPEIASRLYISLNTVKVHARNIYGKLGARNRTQAVARARALGVLPST